MRRIRKKLSSKGVSELSAFLNHPERPEGTLTFHELQGFLFAIACAPESIPPSEWLPIISNDKEIGFQDVAEAERILDQIMVLYNEINSSVLARSDAMPPGCEFLPGTDDNFDERAPVSQWSSGFLQGHDWLSEIWDRYVPDELDELSQELGACIMTLTFFSSRQLAEAYYREGRHDKRRTKRKSLDQFADMMRKLFPSALASYAHLGRTIYEVLARRNIDTQEFGRR